MKLLLVFFVVFSSFSFANEIDNLRVSVSSKASKVARILQEDIGIYDYSQLKVLDERLSSLLKMINGQAIESPEVVCAPLHYGFSVTRIIDAKALTTIIRTMDECRTYLQTARMGMICLPSGYQFSLVVIKNGLQLGGLYKDLPSCEASLSHF